LQIQLVPGSTEVMRTVSIWASGLLASAIPFIFVGAVIAFGACVFDAVGQHAPPARSSTSFQAEATPPEEVLTVARPQDVAQRQPVNHAQSDRRHHDARPPRRSHSQTRVRPSPFEFGFGRWRAAFANLWDRARVQ